MANPERGETRLTIGDHEYTLVLSIDQICDIEERSGKSFADLVMNRTVLGCRWLLWGGLQQYHREQFKSIREVTTLYARPGGLTAMYEDARALIEANELFKAVAPTTGNGGTGDRPPDATSSTGSDSTDTPATSG